MMLLDGYHNRKRYGSIALAKERKLFDSSSNNNSNNNTNNVVAELTSTIKHDITTCLSRMVASIKQSKDAGVVNLRSSCEKVDISGVGGGNTRKSTLDRVLNDQFLKTCPQFGLLQRTKSVKQQQRLVPSVRTHLSRSFSVQQRKIDTSKLKLRYQMSIENLNSIEKRNTYVKSNKADGPRSIGINKFSVVSLLPILAYLTLALLPIFVENASLPPQQQQYGVRPIWLTEGLMNIDSGQDNELDSSSFQADQDDDTSSLEQALINILNDSKQQLRQQSEGNYQPVPLTRAKVEPSWSPFGREILEDSIQSEQQKPKAGQFWVQRRRLDRNRALEPPPWLREQPMRRGYNGPELLPEENELITVPEEVDLDLPSLSPSDDARRPIPGRKLRQSSDEVYDEVLRYLIEEAFQGQDFLNEIYDELELRSKSGLQSGGVKFSNDRPLQPQLQQRVTSQQNTKLGKILDRDEPRLDSDQYNDPNLALVVVSDEVSTGDGPASVAEPAAIPIQTHADIRDQLSASPSLSEDGGMMPIKLQQQSQQPYTQTTSDQHGGDIPIRVENSPYTFETPVAEAEKQQQQSRFTTISSQEPFHVLEEIDQIDDSQSMLSPLQQASQIGQGDNSADQSSRFFEWLSTRNVPSGFGTDNEEQMLPSKREPTRVFGTTPIGETPGLLRYASAEPTKWLGRQAEVASATASQDMPTRGGSRVGMALRMIESGYLSKEQLVQVAAGLRSHLDDMIGLTDGSILDLHPINPRQLLAKLDTNKLSTLQIMEMIQKYDFARGFIVLSWPKGSLNNPIPILVAVLDELAQRNTNADARSLSLSMDDGATAGSTPDPGDMADDITDGRQPMADDERSPVAATGSADIEVMSAASQQPTAGQPPPRVPLAALTALLGAIYANQRQQEIEQLPILVPPSVQALPLGSSPKSGGQHEPLMSGPQFIQLSAIMLAAIGAFVAVKLVMKGQDNRMLLRRSRSNRSLRSFWSFGGANSLDDAFDQQPTDGDDNDDNDIGTSDGKVIADSTSTSKKFQAANFSAATNRGHLAAETDNLVNNKNKNTNDPDEHQKKSLEQLSRKLVSILTGFSHRHHHHHDHDLDQKKSDLEDSKELGGSCSKSDSGLSDDEPQQQQTPYRSSRSYIKALIDVLSKARPFSTGAACADFEDQESRLALGSCGRPVDQLAKDHQRALGDGSGGSNNPATVADARRSDSSDDGNGLDNEVLLSQMDITAAHLILSYMESHLEDKERLRREWLQLNGGSHSQTNPSKVKAVGALTASKVSEPHLQRVAKVALNEENRHKNRDPTIVAFDRNRVRLNSSAGTNRYQDRTTPAPSGKGSRQQQQQQQRTTSTHSSVADYINASFIYEDDPNRSTHIIAQGPLEQTTGHFWQMIWEQGISVIVMLTRLNENSNRQCHCYWPTGSDHSMGAAAATTVQQSTSFGNISPSAGKSLDDVAALPTNGGNAKQQSAAGVVASATPAGHSNETTTSARRGSVTSVFNMTTGGQNGGGGGQKGQPIIGNKDLLSNVICFDVCLGAPADSPLSPTTEAAAASDERLAASSDPFDQDLMPQKCASTKSKRKQQQQAAAATRNKQQSASRSTIGAKVIRFEVHLVSEHVSSNDYLVRNMCLVNRSTGETRTITQFHYLNWPDGGVPDNVKNLLQFRRKVHKSYRNLKSPILVHCSDGAGRSGTYTLIDIILERIRNGAKEIDPMATLVHLREQRVGLCANLSQFEFVLMALAEEIQIILDALPQ